MTSRRERKKQATFERIKAVAWDLFAEHGFEGTTTRAICQRADIGTGTLFSYVDDKAALLVVCFGERVMPLLEAAIASMPSRRLEERLDHLYGTFLNFYADDLRLGRSVLRNILFLEGDSRDAMASMNFTLQLHTARLLAEAQQAHELADDAPIALLSGLVFGAYLSTLVAMLDGMLPSVQAARATFTLAVQTALDGSRPQPGGS